MNKPTPAQIEAAQLAKWIKELKWKSVEKDNMEFEVRTTCYVRDALLKWADLNAAAGVGDGLGSFPEDDPRPGAFHRSAAAEVGEPTTLDKWRHDLNVINHTIERCAQVAEDHMRGTVGRDYGAEIAAAIRALKDST